MRHLIAAVALLGVVGSKPPWRTPTPPAGGLQNSRRNGGSDVPVFVADPMTTRFCKV